MNLEELDLSIESKNIYLRILRPSDASAEYLRWLSTDISKKYIDYSKTNPNIENLSSYIQEKYVSDNCLFFGIFSNKENKHIGNIKYEPIDQENGTAVMGILIGSDEYRGKGIGPESINATASYLYKELNIKHFELGVKEDNTGAVKSYEKVGFKVVGQGQLIKTSDDIIMAMEKNLE